MSAWESPQRRRENGSARPAPPPPPRRRKEGSENLNSHETKVDKLRDK